jgi:HEAT repeat protein
MTSMRKQDSETSPIELTPEESARVNAATAWVGLFARTYKTCRLYERSNPTTTKLRTELTDALTGLLRQHGALTLSFTADEVLCHGQAVNAARSREDNIGLPFFRDGIRSLTFDPGIRPAEVDALLDALLRVTGIDNGEDDLVTLLWDGELSHVDVDYITFTGDLEGGGEHATPEASSRSRWPRESSPVATMASGASTVPPSTSGPGESGNQMRSDDRATSDSTGVTSSALEDLKAAWSVERDRFTREMAAERDRPMERAGLELLAEAIMVTDTDEDRVELIRFAPRILRESLATGAWATARGALKLLRQNGDSAGTIESFIQELQLPHSLTSRQTVQRLDEQDGGGLEGFLELSAELGESAAEWLMRILAESERQRVRRPLAKALAELCRKRPERLSPWLADERWYVVRNVVHVLGWIGGTGLVGWLRVASRHAEPRVRAEVGWALTRIDPDEAAPLALEMLNDNPMPLYGKLLRALVAHPPAQLGEHLLQRIRDPRFAECPVEERRLVHSSLAACATDALLPELEDELSRGNWMPFGTDEHRNAIAHCISKVGSPLAREVLERGAKSRNPHVKRACTEALARLVPRG